MSKQFEMLCYNDDYGDQIRWRTFKKKGCMVRHRDEDHHNMVIVVV